MATKQWFLTATTANSWRTIDEATQTAANNADGWTVSTTSDGTTSPFAVGVKQLATTFSGTTQPDGTLDTTNFDAFRTTNPYTGFFAAGNWTFNFVVRASSSATSQVVAIVARVLIANADGSNATEITSGQNTGGNTAAMSSTTTDFTSSLTISMPAFTVDGQYIFVQVACKRVTGGSMTTADAVWRTGSAATPTGTVITSSTFTPSTPGQGQSQLGLTSKNPWATYVPLATLTIAAALNLPLLFGEVQPQRHNEPQPNPVLARPNLELRGFLHNAQIQLFGRDQFFGAAGQVPNYDWPNPQRGSWLLTDGSSEPGAPAAQNPFSQQDWPNPLRLSRAASDAAQNLLNTLLGSAPPPQPPVPSYDWPNPVRPWRLESNVITIPVAVSGTPTALYDWPNPLFVRARQDWCPPNLLASLLTPPVVAGAPFSQADWPNPAVRQSNQRRFYQQNALLRFFGQDTFFGGAGQPPANLDWPNPTLKTPNLALRTFLNPAAIQLFAQDQFFGAPGQGPANLDWPNPRGYAYPSSLRQFSVDTYLLAGRDQFFGGAGQAPANLDWPNPRGYPYPPSLRQVLASPSLLGQDTFFGGPGQPPANQDWPLPTLKAPNKELRVFQWPAPTQFYGQDGFFGGPGQAPPNRDWPNPTTKQPNLELRTFLNPAETQLFGQDQFFGAAGQGPAYDWPNPQIKAPSHLRTFINTVALQLIGRDQFFTSPGQGPNYDWPNPLRRTPPTVAPWPNLITSLLTLPPPPPFALLDWPNPLGRMPILDQRTFILAAQTKLFGQDVFFGAAGQAPVYDWPNPLRRGQPTIAPWPNLTASTLAIVLSPFAQTDWPNPFGRGPIPDQRTYTLAAQTKLFGQDQFFTAPGDAPNYDWPNPQGPRTRAQAVANFWINLNGTTLVPGPFAPIDWPNPTTSRPNLELRTYLFAAPTRLFGQDVFFGGAGQAPANLDWPNPRGYAYPASLRQIIGPVYLVGGQDQFFGGPGQPPANTDWPNPTLKLPNKELRSFIKAAETRLFGQDRFFTSPGQGPNYDWTNPLRARDGNRILPWQNNTAIYIPGTPFAMRDWPNPLIRWRRPYLNEYHLYTQIPPFVLVPRFVLLAGDVQTYQSLSGTVATYMSADGSVLVVQDIDGTVRVFQVLDGDVQTKEELG